MALITAKRSEPCTACGVMVNKGEQAWYTQENGVRHPEPSCANAARARPRPNRHAGTCICGAHVPSGKGTLSRLGASWAVHCEHCSS